MDGFPRTFLVLAVVCSTVSEAQAWEYRRPDSHAMHMHDIHMAPIYACALVDRFKPNLSDHMVQVEIAKSPYGPLSVRMGWTRVIRVRVSSKRYPKRPSTETFEKVRHWVVSQLDKDPPLCRLVLSRLYYASMKLEIAGCTRSLNEPEYVVEHLRLAQLAAKKGDQDMAWKWADSAFAQYAAMPKKARRKMRGDKRLRDAAYQLVHRPAPPGLSDLGRKSYCDMYRRIASMFPPKNRSQRSAIRTRRSALRCR